VELIRRTPGPSSAVAGVLAALTLIAFASRTVTPIGFVLAAFLGFVFAVSMYLGLRRWSC
jgi:hypothetical protein